MDADDYLHPEYFEILLKGLANREAEASCCKWTWDVCGNPNLFPKVSPSFEVLSAEEAFASGKIEKGSWCKIVKRDAIGKIEFDENLVFFGGFDLYQRFIIEWFDKKGSIYTIAALLLLSKTKFSLTHKTSS